MVPSISGNLPAQAGQMSDPTIRDGSPPISVPQTTGQSGTGSKPIGVPQPSTQDLEKALSATLKNTGFKSEVDTSNPGQVVVRIVDSVTGDLVVQIPSSVSIAVAEALRKESLASGNAPSGSLFDEAA
jgi:hypothetical protein